MKYECGMIEDLLPLYKDKACSQATAAVVEEHLAECPGCRELLNSLSDTAIDEVIAKEKDEVIQTQSRYFKTKGAVAGGIIAAVFAVPILVCLIVNLASGHGLTWFFIVLAAMLIPTSLIVVPLIAPKNRMFQAMVGFTVSVILLLAVCCIYSRGSWFFVAASSVLFGLTVCFMPFIACHEPVKAYLGNAKGLTVMAACTVTFFLMMICIGIFAHTPGFFQTAFGISVPLVLMVWIVFAIIRYLPANGFVKAGVAIAALGITSSGMNFWMEQVVLNSFMTDDTGVLIYTTPSALNAIGGLAIGAVLALIGLLVGKKGGKGGKES